MADTLETALTFVLALNLLIVIAQGAIININPAASVFYNGTGSLYDEFDADNYTLDDSDPASRLPTSQTGDQTGTGNFFTDAFTSIKQWFLDTTGVSYVLSILGAPYHLMQFIGLPKQIAFLIGAMWYGITLFLIISFFWGGR